MARTPSNKPNGRDTRLPAEKPRTPGTPISERESTPRPWSPPPAAAPAAPTKIAPQAAPKAAPAAAAPVVPSKAAPAASSRTSTAVATPGPAPTREEIAGRAKAIWRAGGCQGGRDERNWLEAERQLRSERGLS
jgi:hypothetical protein